MPNIDGTETATQSPPLSTPALADVDNAIRSARVALLDGRLDSAIDRLREASCLAAETCSADARELANLASALSPALETVKLFEMCLDDMFAEP